MASNPFLTASDEPFGTASCFSPLTFNSTFTTTAKSAHFPKASTAIAAVHSYFFEKLQRPEIPSRPWLYPSDSYERGKGPELNVSHSGHLPCSSGEGDTSRKISQTIETGDHVMDKLQLLLDELSEKEASYPSSVESVIVCQNIEAMMEAVCDNLRNHYRMFGNCKLLKTGSMYEGLKVGKPDEFDFMIELPALADDMVLQYSQNTYFQTQTIAYSIKDEQFFDDILKECSQDLDDLMTAVLGTLEHIVQDEVKKHLLQGWEYVTNPVMTNSRVLPQMAITPLLKWKGKEFEELYVSIDLSFAIPLLKSPLWERGRSQFFTSNSKANETELSDSTETYYALIRDTKSCRMSFSLEEKGIMAQYSVTSGQNKCLRLLKYMRDAISAKKFDLSLLEMKSDISTYWFKTIMYYQFAKYQMVPEKWEADGLSFRMMEALEELLVCLKSGKLYSFFIPNYNLLKDYSDPTKYATAIKDVEEMLHILASLKSGKMTVNDFWKIEEEKRRADDILHYQGRRSFLIDLFYMYAYDDYIPSGLAVIQEYVQRHFKGSMTVNGSGKDVQLLENDELIDIDKELEKEHNEVFSYFK